MSSEPTTARPLAFKSPGLNNGQAGQYRSSAVLEATNASVMQVRSRAHRYAA